MSGLLHVFRRLFSALPWCYYSTLAAHFTRKGLDMSKRISLIVPDEVVDQAQRFADAVGVQLASLLKMIIFERLFPEEMKKPKDRRDAG